MKLKFLGANKTVTGSCFLLKSKGVKILIDCGLFQGQEKEKNYEPFDFDPKEIDFLLVTHSHLDHIGRIPKLIKEGFKGKILSTFPTKDLAPIMLLDSYYIMKEEAEALGKKRFFERSNLKKMETLWQAVDYDKKIKLNSDISCCFRDGGHVLGSSIIEIWIEGKKVVFSGDLGNPPTPLLSPPSSIRKADFLVVESTYGDRIHEDKKERKDLLENTIEDTITKKGALMIPAFALERTQELLFELNSLVENHRIPKVPIFIDSPLAIEALAVYKKYPQLYNKKAFYLIKSGDDLFNFPGLRFCETRAQSKEINDALKPKVIIAGSGMSTGGRILHHEIRYLPDPNSCLLLICYQAKGTLGREIFEGAKEVKIFNEKVPVKCQVKAIGGYSAHADQLQLLKWIKNIKLLKKVFVVHGEEGSKVLSQKIKDKLGLSAIIPNYKEEFSL